MTTLQKGPIMSLHHYQANDPELPHDFSFYRERAHLLRRQETSRIAQTFLERLSAMLKRRKATRPRQG
jgi:hypothetical protein